jgi:hypothetical protein
MILPTDPKTADKDAMNTQDTAIIGTRYDARTGQYFPTINGISYSPTSFEEDRALEIARLIIKRALKQP